MKLAEKVLSMKQVNEKANLGKSKKMLDTLFDDLEALRSETEGSRSAAFDKVIELVVSASDKLNLLK